MKRAIVIGHFAFGLEFLDGQTVKTKIITDELCREFGDDQIGKVDTHGCIRSLLNAPFKIWCALRNSRNVIILPAKNGLKVYAPLLALERRLFKNKKVHYVVIGGWLPSFLKGHPYIKQLLRAFDGIYVETNTMKKALEGEGFCNVFVMPNCKRLTILSETQLIYHRSEPYRLCTFSRVMKEKGIEDAVNAVKAVNSRIGRTIYTLDIFGQIDSTQMEWFRNLQEKFDENIQYCGTVPYEQSTEVLKSYFALLFPTYYDGEGFAGTLIDALAAGLPVLASDWQYNKEVIKEGVTGKIFKAKDVQNMVDMLIAIASNRYLLDDMKKNCINEAYKYEPQNALEVLCNNLRG